MATDDYTAELWKTIPFAPDYEVSTHGRIKRGAPEPAHRCGRLLKPKIDTNGYLAVCLYRNRKKLSIQVHRAVCITFHGECPPDKSEAGHIDGDRTNARADNLRWVTRVENRADRKRHGTECRGESNGNAVLTKLKVEAIHLLSQTMGVRKIAAVVGVSKSQVSNIVRGASWSDSAPV